MTATNNGAPTVVNNLPSPATLLTPRAARVLLRIITKAAAKTAAESEEEA
jgi:hypothetical protein